MSVIINEIEVENAPEQPPEAPDAAPASTPSSAFAPFSGVGANASAEEHEAALTGPRLYGVYPALVIDNSDPKYPGAVTVALPWLPDENGDHWEVEARLVQFAAGPGRGAWFMPEIGDEVLVAFEAGDPNRAYVIGAMWNGRAQPPGPDPENRHKEISTERTRISIEDDRTAASVTIEIKDRDRKIIVHEQDGIEIREGGARILIRDGSIELEANKSIKLTAGSTIDLSAGLVTISSGMTTASGVVKADTLLANSVVAESYTPGAGNIW